MYLFDTDILSNLVKRTPSVVLIGRIARVRPELQFTSSITVGELLYGTHRLGERGNALRANIEETILADIQVLSFDTRAARIYARIRAGLEEHRMTIGDADTRIASIALAHDLTVVSANLRHFRRVPGLVVENWLT